MPINSVTKNNKKKIYIKIHIGQCMYPKEGDLFAVKVTQSTDY